MLKKTKSRKQAVCVTLVLVSLSASSEDLGCLQAEAGSAEENTSATREIATDLTDRVHNLQNALGIKEAVPIRYSSKAGVGRAIAPCGSSSVGTPFARIETDKAALLSANNPLITVDLVLAHELSHVLQFGASQEFTRTLCNHTLRDVKVYELLADFGAGYALYKIGRRNAQLEFANAVSALADYAFSSTLHHGTVSERMNAFNMGQASAYFGQVIKMDVLLRNKEVFLRAMSGENEQLLRGQSTGYVDFARHALEEIYK